MDWTNLGATLLQLGLPALGTAFGGPLGGTIGGALGQAIAGALKVDPTPQAVQAAIVADPDAAKAKLADLESARQNELAMFQAETADRTSARGMLATLAAQHSPSEWTPVVLSFLTVVLWFGFVGALFFVRVDIPERLYNLLLIGFGTTSTQLGIVYSFWFGTSRGAQKSADALRGLAAANSNAPDGLARQLGAAVGQAIRKAA